MRGNDDGWGNATRPDIVVDNRTQRRAMQMIEVGVGDQDKVDRRKIRDAQARTTKTLQYEQPAGKIGVNDDAFSANLNKETCVTDESDTQFPIRCEARFVGLTRAWSHRRMPHQASELCGAFAQRRITKSLFDHPSTGPGSKLALWAIPS